MIDAVMIYNQVKEKSEALAPMAPSSDEFEICETHIASIRIDVIMFTPVDDLIPVQIRKDKDTLGWMYNKDNRHIIIKGQNKTMTLNNLKKIVEFGVKEKGKKFSESPEEFMLMKRDDGSIYTFVSAKELIKRLC